jgi:NAD(P)H-dependent FMN reductase
VDAAESDIHVLVPSGALRRDSWTQRLVQLAAQRLLEAGAAVSLFDLRDYSAPPHDGDLEAQLGLPALIPMRELQTRLAATHGFLLCVPECNGSQLGTFKNVLDWP